MRPALVTELTTPRMTDPAGTSTRSLAVQIDERRRLEAILDLRGRRAERVLQPDVELGADRDDAGPSTDVRRRLAGSRVSAYRSEASSRPGVSPRAPRADLFDSVAQVGVLAARHGLVLPQLDLQIGRLVAQIRRARPAAATRARRRARELARRRGTRRRSRPAAAECRVGDGLRSVRAAGSAIATSADSMS